MQLVHRQHAGLIRLYGWKQRCLGQWVKHAILDSSMKRKIWRSNQMITTSGRPGHPNSLDSTQQQSALTLKSAGCTRLSRRKIGGKYSGSQFHLAKTVKLL
jgi:hypothetical protein